MVAAMVAAIADARRSAPPCWAFIAMVEAGKADVSNPRAMSPLGQSRLSRRLDFKCQQRTLPEVALWVQAAPVHFEKAQLSAMAQSTRLPMGDRIRTL
jgi:hypothetical protein